MAERKLAITITGDASKAKRALGDLDKSVGKSERSIKKSGGGIKSTLAGLGLGAALVGSFKAFDEASKVAAQTEAVIKSTGGAANVTAKQVGELSDAISKKSGIDDEAIQTGANMLATFTNIRNEVGKGKDIFNQTTQAATDMAVAMGTDVKSAALTLGKALNDPVAGLGKLQKQGVTFTKSQKELIKSLVASGDTLGAQQVILAEVNKEFGGSAEAQATSLGKAKVAVDNMAESLGGALAPGLNVAADAAAIFASALGALPPAAQTGVVVAGAALAVWLKWGDGLSSFAGKAAKAVGSLDNLKLGMMGQTEKGAGASNAVGGLINKMGGLGAAATFGGIATGGLALALVGTQMEAKKAAARAAEFKAAVESVRQTAISTGKSVKQIFADLTIPDLFGDMGPQLKKAGVSARDLQAAVTGSKKGWEEYRDATIAANGETTASIGIAGTLGNTLQQQRDKYLQSSAAVKAQKEAQQGANAAAKESTGPFVAAAAAVGTAATQSKNLADQLTFIKEEADKSAAAIRGFYDATTGGLKDQIDVEAALDSLTESFKTNGRTLDINEEKGRANQAALIAMKDAAVQTAVGVQEATGSTDAGIVSLTGYAGRLAETARGAGYTEGEIQVMLTTMGLTPSQIATTFETNAPATTGQVTNLKASMDRLPGKKTIYINASVTGFSALQRTLEEVTRDRFVKIRMIQDRVSPGQINQRRAHGGPVSERMGPVLVGEEGPEIVTFGQTGMVHDASSTRSMLASNPISGMASSSGAGTTQVVNVYVTQPLATAAAVGDMVAKALRDKQSRSGNRKILAGLA